MPHTIFSFWFSLSISSLYDRIIFRKEGIGSSISRHFYSEPPERVSYEFADVIICSVNVPFAERFCTIYFSASIPVLGGGFPSIRGINVYMYFFLIVIQFNGYK